MLVIARLLISIALATLIASCTRSTTRSANWTRVHTGQPLPVNNTARPAALPATPNEDSMPAESQPGATAPGEVSTILSSSAKWLRLGDWANAALGITPKRIVNGSSYSYSLETQSGSFVLTPETRLASFEGVSLWLGFAPFWADGDCFVHELDLQKNVLPLLTISTDPLPFSGTIVIDPGHGGGNLGTRSVLPNLFEKDLTLDWALRLEPLLKQQGWKVVLTRREDRDLSLTERVQIADLSRADLFLSLHFNSALPQTEQAGLETFCTTPAGLPSTLTRGYEDDATRIFPNNAHDVANLRYAIRLHRGLLQLAGMTDRSVRRARFMGVLRTQQRPAVLLEAGYLSNPAEARRAATPGYRQLLAEAVANALAAPSALASTLPPDALNHQENGPGR